MQLREQLADRAEVQKDQMARRAGASGFGAGGFGGGGGHAPQAAAALGAMPATQPPIDAMASVESIASAAKVGELFQYTVGSVSIARQQSAMLPIVTDPIQVEKLSIYNQGVMPTNPLLGARLKNTTGKFLMQGPITVLAEGA